MTMPILGLVGMTLGGPPSPDEHVIGIIGDPFAHDDMAICGVSEDDGTSSEEESPGLLDDSSTDEDCFKDCSTDEEDDCGPMSSCTAGGSCCYSNAPPWQQLMPARWRITGDTGGAGAPRLTSALLLPSRSRRRRLWLVLRRHARWP